MAQVLARSRTLRAQCLRIAASPTTRVTVLLSTSPMDATARARSYARRYESGLLIVEVQIPPASRDFAELLAHELEHVTELIDGVNFRALAAARTGTIVQDRSDGSFESERARRAGIAAAAEVARNRRDGCRGSRGYQTRVRRARPICARRSQTVNYRFLIT